MPTEQPFITSKKQLLRLSVIVPLLKLNEEVKVSAIIEELEKAERVQGLRLGTGSKTVYRDIQVLREKYQCPVEYDPRKGCYELKDRQWDLSVPALLSDTEVLTAVMGAKFAEILFDPDTAFRFVNAAREIMQTNNADSPVADRMDSLHILSTEISRTKNVHMAAVLDAWCQCRRLDVTYESAYGKVEARIIEPHGLVYYGKNWYILAHCHKVDDRRMFNAARIQRAAVLQETFVPDQEIIQSFDVDELLIFTKMRDIVIRLRATGVRYARPYKLHPRQKMEKQENGDVVLTVPAAHEKDIVSWILQQRGEAVPLEPESLVQAVRAAAKKLLGEGSDQPEPQAKDKQSQLGD